MAPRWMAPLVVTLTFAVGGWGTPVQAQTPRQSVRILGFGVFYPMGSFRVGYHAAAQLTAGCPGYWDSRGHPVGVGQWGFSSAQLVTGVMPPGLNFNPQSGDIEGTPQQPGNWQISIRLYGLYCYTNDNRQVDMATSTPPNQIYPIVLQVSS